MSQNNEIMIDFLNHEYHCHVQNVRWCLELFLENIGEPYSMIFKENGEDMILDDIYIGDVYFAGEQSNMEFKMKQLPKYKNIKIKKKIICYLNVPQDYYIDQEQIYPREKVTLWQKVNLNNIGELSAVAYYFASSLDIDIPIGIISNNKGGTSASC